MKKKIFSLYASRLLCLCFALLLTSCISHNAPYQSLSEARQALSSAKLLLSEQKDTEGLKTLALAEGILRDGEEALSQDKFSVATTLFETSKKHSQAILKRQQNMSDERHNLNFRY